MLNLAFSKQKTYQEVIENELQEAQNDLLKSEKSLEYWQAMTDMMRNRVARLQARSTTDVKSTLSTVCQ